MCQKKNKRNFENNSLPSTIFLKYTENPTTYKIFDITRKHFSRAVEFYENVRNSLLN